MLAIHSTERSSHSGSAEANVQAGHWWQRYFMARSLEEASCESALRDCKHGLSRPRKGRCKEGAKYGVRANVICPGFVRTRWSTSRSRKGESPRATEQQVIKNTC